MSDSETAHARRHGGIGLVRGEWRTSRATSVLQHISIPLYSGTSNMNEAEDRVLRTLELVGAAHLERRRTSELGLSERMLVELARAIIHEPRLLLVDEPAVFRKPEDARAFYTLLRSLPQETGCAQLIASEEATPLRGCKPMMSLAYGQLSSTMSRRKVIDFPTLPGGAKSAS
jgi:ABC-type ATPase involved in cell division